jgi:hypothetical protein
MKRKLEICFTHDINDGSKKHGTILFVYDQTTISESKELNSKISQYIEDQGFINGSVYSIKEV